MRQNSSPFAAPSTRTAFPLALFLVFVTVTAASAVDRRDIPIPRGEGAVLETTLYTARFPGPGALLIPSCQGRRNQYDSLGAKLSSSRTHVISFDYRAGVEGTVGSPALMADLSAALETLLAQRNLERTAPMVLGFGCGAASAIELAAARGDVRALILISPDLARLGDGASELFAKIANVPIFLANAEHRGTSAAEAKRLFEANTAPLTQWLLSKGDDDESQLFTKDSGLKSKIEAWIDDVLKK